MTTRPSRMAILVVLLIYHALLSGGMSAQQVGTLGRTIPQGTSGGGGGGGTPGAPTNLSVLADTDTDVSIAWDRADDTDTSLDLERALDVAGTPGAYGAITLEQHANDYEDSSLDPATKYWYRVREITSGTPSAYSTAVSVTTAAFAGNSTPTITSITPTVNSASRVTLTWTDPADQAGGSPRYIVERSSDGGVTYIPIDSPYCASPGSTETFVDYPLSAATTYHWRIRKVNNTSYGPYTYASATTNANGANPALPLNLVATTTSATSTTLTWTDTNGAASTYQVETGPPTGTDLPKDATYSQVTETATGATSFTLSTTANTPVFVRLRAHQSGNESDYTCCLMVRPASTGTGGSTYNIGPGQTFTHIGDLDWRTLGPGDTVNIHYATYPEKFAITRRGTAASPIVVNCLPDGSGNKPIITGQSATTNAQFALQVPFEDLALLHLGKLPGDPTASEAGYVTISGCDLEFAHPENSPSTYTMASGATSNYIAGAAGIYIGRADHITIKNCDVHDNSNGFFGAALEDESRRVSDITFDGNHVYGNGTSGGFSTHNSYMEGQRIIYQFNHYGPLRATSGGGGIKDRSSSVIVRYNYLEGGANRIQLVEAQNAFRLNYADPGYNASYVYGNVFSTTDADTSIFLLEYGGDSGSAWEYRKGILYAAYNTMVGRYNLASFDRLIFFRMRDDAGTKAGVFDVRNNVIVTKADTGTDTNGYLVDLNGRVWLGKNWISPAYTGVRQMGGNGIVTGTANLITSTGNAPSFTSISTGDYRPNSSPFAGQTPTPLPGSYPAAINLEYVIHTQQQARSALTTMGYYQ